MYYSTHTVTTVHTKYLYYSITQWFYSTYTIHLANATQMSGPPGFVVSAVNYLPTKYVLSFTILITSNFSF